MSWDGPGAKTDDLKEGLIVATRDRTRDLFKKGDWFLAYQEALETILGRGDWFSREIAKAALMSDENSGEGIGDGV